MGGDTAEDDDESVDAAVEATVDHRLEVLSLYYVRLAVGKLLLVGDNSGGIDY